MDSNMIKTKVFSTTLPKVRWAKETPYWSPTLKGPKHVHPIYPSVIYIHIYRTGEKNYTEISDQQLLRATVRPINQVKRLTKGPDSLSSTPHWRHQSLLYKKIDKMVRG